MVVLKFHTLNLQRPQAVHTKKGAGKTSPFVISFKKIYLEPDYHIGRKRINIIVGIVFNPLAADSEMSVKIDL